MIESINLWTERLSNGQVLILCVGISTFIVLGVQIAAEQLRERPYRIRRR